MDPAMASDSSEFGLYRPDTDLYMDMSSVPALNNNFPYPFEYVPQGAPRSPTDVDSPFTAEGSFDALDGFNSPGVTFNSPYLSSGDISFTNSSPSMSPLTRDLGNVFLEVEDAPLERPSIFRIRSQSVTEATVAPSDTWRDPCGRPRSASYSSPAPSTSRTGGDQIVESSSELDAIDLNDDFNPEGGYPYGEGGLTSFPNSGFLTSRNPSPALPSIPTGELNSSTLFAPADDFPTTTDIAHPMPRHPSPRQPVALSLNTDLSSHVPASGRYHYRNRSDSYCLSADSPTDRRGNGLTHRSSLSSPESRRHSPYPSIHSSPASVTSESQLSPYLSNLDITELSPSTGSSPHRRSTLSVTRSPTLKVDNTLQRVSSDPSSTRYGLQRRRNGNPRPSPGPSYMISSDSSIAAMTVDTGSRITPFNGSYLSDVDSVSAPTTDKYKPVVASQRIVQASNLRRTREARFICEYEGCLSTFTAKHNLRSTCNIIYHLVQV
ncbi:hypothetical protein BDZ94DRAFT_172866 [Collybia nuda]|uniref:Uncharacterized protein n=1 Tax=Collybia nuda TaxID=64659 RepID=A0A9P6CNB9_9AGAR|nr:hypothetical protein BDZ94DRAFT_172866 [Collybia nuda]